MKILAIAATVVTVATGVLCAVGAFCGPPQENRPAQHQARY